jgi:Rrf2 family nitric oxide-sensitive transcriptional repressor
MQLTRFTDYALRVLIYLAHRPGGRCRIKEVSDAHAISEDHLMKVVQRLAALGYIKATRGKNGGIEAARAAADISIGAVVRDVESLAPVECFVSDYDGRCQLYPNCGLRGALQSAQLQFLKTLDGYSVADVMGSNALTFLPHARSPVRNPSRADVRRTEVRRTARPASRQRLRSR